MIDRGPSQPPRTATAAALLDPSQHPIIGHRGASGLAPENTLASFALAQDQGADAFEFDVRVSADGVAVVFHDPTLDRTTDRSGSVASLGIDDLASADAGARFSLDGGRSFPFRDQGIGIPTLREVLEAFPQTPLLIELKVAEAVDPVRRELLRAGAAQRCVVASFLGETVAKFREAPFQSGASRRDIVSLYWRSWLGVPRDRGALLYAVPDRYRGRLAVPTRRFVAAARRFGRPVHVWTVNDVAEAEELWSRGCAGIVTNYPGALVTARNARFDSTPGPTDR